MRCSCCDATLPAGAIVCPHCGWQFSKPMQVQNTVIPAPQKVSSISKQQAVLVLDVSGSMAWEKKAKSVQEATKALLAELAQDTNKDGFAVAVVHYNETAVVAHRWERASELHQHLLPLKTGGYTNITDGLQQALNLLKEPPPDSLFPNQVRVWVRPIVVLMSDGCHNTGPEPDSVAKEIKKEADLVTVAFGSDADTELLKRLATSPDHYFFAADGKELRKVFAVVGSTSRIALSTGVSFSQARKMRQTH